MIENLKKLRIMKLWEILNRESDEDHPITTEELLDRLVEIGIPCHRKTLYEDIKTLNDCGYEVMVNRSVSNEYYVMERTFDVPELQILMDAVQATRFISESKTESFVRKIASLAGDKKGEVLNRNIVAFNTSKCSNEHVFYNVNEIALALEQKRKISFYYFKLNAQHEKVYQRSRKKYVVNPLATVFADDKYYLMCFDDKHGNVVHYRVDRMETVTMEDEPMTENEISLNFDVKGYKKQIFGMCVGDQEEVEFCADESIVDGLFDKFGDDLVLTEKDGKVYFKAMAQISTPFIAWVMGFGDKLKVTAPQKVVKKIKEHLRKTVDNYKE